MPAQPWIATTADAIHALTKGTAPLLPLGLTLLGILVTITIATTGISLMLGRPIDMEQLARKAFGLAAIGTVLTFWVIDIPGVGMSFSDFLPKEGQALAATIGTTGIDETNAHLEELMARMTAPNLFTMIDGVRQAFFFMLFSGLLLLAQGVGMCVLTFAMVGTSVALLFGPLLVNMALIPPLAGMWWGYVRLLITFALMPSVLAAWSLVSSRLLYQVLATLPPGDFLVAPATHGVLVATLITVLVGTVSVPWLASSIFSHAAHAGSAGVAAVAARVVR